jgi:DNA-binding transcriptional MerR regulator
VDIILIGDAARRLGITTWRLLQAEKRGEIPRPAGKTRLGWRVYSEADMAVLLQWREAVAAREAARAAQPGRRRRRGGIAQAA